jgi:hypothetical protein
MHIPERPSQTGLKEYLKENPSQYIRNNTYEPVRPNDLFTNAELVQSDNDDVLYFFNRLTIQEELSSKEEIIFAQALIHAIEKVQKNLDNLI